MFLLGNLLTGQGKLFLLGNLLTGQGKLFLYPNPTVMYAVNISYNLLSGLQKDKKILRFFDTLFYALRNHQGEVVIVAGVYLLL